MYVIAFANPKGGTGKTTSSLLLAEQIAKAGGRVTILDCDPNQNLVNWANKRETTPFNIIQRPREQDVVDVIDSLEGKTDYLIIDLEGTASQIVTFALSRADLAVIPLEPNSVEGPHAAKAVSLVKQTGQMLRREIPYTILITKANAAFMTTEERELREEMSANGIQVLPVRIIRRSAYTRIFGEGALLDELLASSDERAAVQTTKAIENAREYAQALTDMFKAEAA